LAKVAQKVCEIPILRRYSKLDWTQPSLNYQSWTRPSPEAPFNLHPSMANKFGQNIA